MASLDQQQCPGAVINPCHLIHPVVTTPKVSKFFKINLFIKFFVIKFKI